MWLHSQRQASSRRILKRLQRRDHSRTKADHENHRTARAPACDVPSGQDHGSCRRSPQATDSFPPQEVPFESNQDKPSAASKDCSSHVRFSPKNASTNAPQKYPWSRSTQHVHPHVLSYLFHPLHVQGLRRKCEFDSLFIKALQNRHIHPLRKRHIAPIIGRMVPVYHHNIE